MSINQQISTRRQLRGVVISNKMTKTVSVKVDRTVVHPKYGKRYTKSAKYLAHDEASAAKPGDSVVIEETRPMSALKRWRVVEIKPGVASL
ncbi:MAG: 30S ribosomal protein S17 [Patescibacteria group bacterium]